MQLQYLPLVLISTFIPVAELGHLSGNETRFFAPILASQSDRSNNGNPGTPSGRRSPGGTRPEGAPIGDCPAKNKTVMAIVPENARGFTTQDYPVFWFYIPYTETEVHSIEFVLTDPDPNDPKTIYETDISLQNTPAILAVSLPQEQESALQRDRSYQWWLTINCTEKRIGEKNDIDLEGWIVKISPEERDSSVRIWYDEVTETAEQYRNNPDNLQAQNQWRQLLQSLGLAQFFTETIAE